MLGSGTAAGVAMKPNACGVGIQVAADDHPGPVDPGRHGAEDGVGVVDRRVRAPDIHKSVEAGSESCPTMSPASLIPAPNVDVEPGTVNFV